MLLLASRTYPFLDSLSLVEHQARDTLFRIGSDKFLLHMAARDSAEADDRLVWLDCRAALLWINATTEEYGLEWQ